MSSLANSMQTSSTVRIEPELWNCEAVQCAAVLEHVLEKS